jgi:hypothetical protein
MYAQLIRGMQQNLIPAFSGGAHTSSKSCACVSANKSADVLTDASPLLLLMCVNQHLNLFYVLTTFI